MAVWTALAAVTSGTALFVAIGLITYTIYKLNTKQNLHTAKAVKSKPRDSINNFSTYEDIKPKSDDADLGHKNVGSTSVSNKDAAKTAKHLNDLSSQNRHQEVQTNNIPINISSNKCHQETQTARMHVDEESRFNCRSSNLHHQDSQMSNSLSNLPQNMNLNIDRLDNDGCSDVSRTNNETESVHSFASTAESVSSDISSVSIPTWYEMSDAERTLYSCTACGGIITTVTYPCKHPYLCGKCAPILFKFYHRCPSCRRRIKSFDNVF